jgi:hypothetical protein
MLELFATVTTIWLPLLRKAWKVADEQIEDWFAIKAAAHEAVESQLPGRENGPADAYRHLLWGPS